jgi:hypothetical protein
MNDEKAMTQQDPDTPVADCLRRDRHSSFVIVRLIRYSGFVIRHSAAASCACDPESGGGG